MVHWTKISPLGAVVLFWAAALCQPSLGQVAQAPPEPAGVSLFTQLLAGDGDFGDNFGVSVSIEGDTAIIGANQDAEGGSGAGAAYIFVRNGAVWTEQQKLIASDAANFDSFGFSVSVSGDIAVVGAYADDNAEDNTGSVYIFVRDAGVWTQEQKLTGSQDVVWFGYSVAVSNDTLAVGVPADFDNGTFAGAVHVFTRSGTTWTEQQKLTASDGAVLDNLGYSVAISDDTIVAGAFGDDVVGFDSGSAYVFTRSGTTWTEEDQLTPSDGAAHSWFGYAVDVDGDTAIGGAYMADSETGSAYVFTRSGASWTEQQKLVASDGVSGDRFGWTVGVGGDLALVGAPYTADNGSNSGAAYAFRRDGSLWTEEPKLLDPLGEASDFFGTSVSVDGTTTLIGSPSDNDSTTDAGSTFVYGPGPSLSISGTCPGSMAIGISQATPGGKIIVLHSDSPGVALVPVGSCTGRRVDLATPSHLATINANGLGEFSATPVVPAAGCGRYVQALDVGSCSTTTVEQIPD